MQVDAAHVRINELSAAVARLSDSVRELRIALAERDAMLAERDATLAERDREVAVLRQRVAKLEELRNQNSSNSGRPPSSDSPAERTERRTQQPRRKKSGKKRGGQPGHKGSRRELVAAERVDTTVRVSPSDVCVCACGAGLDAAEVVGLHRHQVWELPEMLPHITEYQLEERACPCGRQIRAILPEGVSPSAFGPRLTAWVSMLTGAYRMSRRRTQALLHDLLSIQMSLGAISACEERVSRALRGPAEEAWRAVQQAPVKHVDASTWWQQTQRLSLWVLATTTLSVFVTTARATRDAVVSVLGKDKSSTWVTDRATVFNHRQGTARQTCWAHLLRYFEAMRLRAGPSGKIGRQLLVQSLAMFRVWHEVKAGEVSRAEFRTRMKPFQENFRRLLQAGRDCGHDATAGTCANILDHHWDALWTFVIVKGVEPTNNHAEQELRPAVLWRRTSYASQSTRGVSFVERMMTVALSLRKQGAQPHAFVVQALEAHLLHRPHPSLLPRSIAAP